MHARLSSTTFQMPYTLQSELKAVDINDKAVSKISQRPRRSKAQISVATARLTETN